MKRLARVRALAGNKALCIKLADVGQSAQTMMKTHAVEALRQLIMVASWFAKRRFIIELSFARLS